MKFWAGPYRYLWRLAATYRSRSGPVRGTEVQDSGKQTGNLTESTETIDGAARIIQSLYDAARSYFVQGKVDIADSLFRLYLEHTGQSDLVDCRHTNDYPAELDYARFERRFRTFLAGKRRDWQAGTLPLPKYIQKFGAKRVDSGVLNRASVLFILPQYIFNSDRFVECDIKDHLYESAVNAGIDANYFYGDRILYPHLRLNPVKANADLKELRELIRRMRPSVIVFDANFVGSDVSINSTYLNSIKDEFAIRMVGFMGDVWGTHWVEIANYWGSVADLLMHISPSGTFETACSFGEKMFSSSYPVNRRNFFRDQVREFDLSFFGSHAYLRPFWLLNAMRAASELGLKTNISVHQRTNDCPAMADYAKTLRRSKIVLNFSSRSATVKMLTGRAWQTLSSGSLLLEEENEEIKHFFVPFVHYVPFENAFQLRQLIEFFYNNHDEAEAIGERASEFCAEYYNATSVWARVLDALMAR